MNRNKIFDAIHYGIPSPSWQGNVVIVGAGAAGLSAAHILRKSGANVQVLEADPQYGGRIRSYTGFYNYPVELGAEIVHGKRNIWYDLIKHQSKELLKYEDYYDEYYQLDGQLVGEYEIEYDPDLLRAIDFMEEIEAYSGPADMSVAEFIRKSGLNRRVHHLLEAWIGAEYGTSTHKISLQSLVKASKQWASGSGDFVFTRDAYISALEEIFADTLACVRVNTPVTRIDSQNQSIRVIDDQGNSWLADRVVVTVPLPILKSNFIHFIPAWPSEKLVAVQNLGMDVAIKIIMLFQHTFWEEETGSIYGQGLIPEFYTSAKNDTPILTAYITGDKAQTLSKMGTQAIDHAVNELDQIFGYPKASANFIKAQLMDWSQEPFIRGAYSFPSPQALRYRRVLAEPLQNQIFFAGEASNYHGHPATVQGAIETGYRAACEVLGVESVTFSS
ncbi:MAG: FAD-dependent oxidoreductase [Bacteroidia bacterium]|nr:FAD-dependent oxidoreductase [Bacteroidia bacterium]